MAKDKDLKLGIKPAKEPEPKPEPKAEPKASVEAPKRAPLYVVKPGRSIATKRGVRGPGEVVEARELGGGKDALEDLVASGHLQKKE